MLLFIYGPKEYIYFISPYVIPPLIIFLLLRLITIIKLGHPSRILLTETIL
jgi:hypothetical protein